MKLLESADVDCLAGVHGRVRSRRSAHWPRLFATVFGAFYLASCSTTHEVAGTGQPPWVNDPGSYYPYKPEGLVYAVGAADKGEAGEVEQQKKEALRNATAALARDVRVKVQGQAAHRIRKRAKIEKTDGLDSVAQAMGEKFASLSGPSLSAILKQVRTDAVHRDALTGKMYVLCSVIVPNANESQETGERQSEATPKTAAE